MADSKVTTVLELDNDQFKREAMASKNELKELADEAGKAADSVDFQNGIEAVKDLTKELGELSRVFTEAGSRARKMERDIRQAFSNPAEAEAMLASARQIKDEFGELVEEEDISQAVKRLDTLGIATEANLKRITKLALDAGKDLEGAADDVGEFLAPFESGNFDAGVLDSLRANFGISAKALKAYGAELDANNEILAETESQQRKAQQALIRYIDENERFNDIATRSQDAMSKFNNEFNKLTTGVGQELNKVKNIAAELALPILEWANTASDEVKLGVGVVSVAAAGVGELGIKIGQAAAIARLAGVDFGKLSTSIRGLSLSGFATGLGGTVLALGGLGLAAAAVATSYKAKTKAIIDAQKAQDSLIATQSRAIASDKDLIAINKVSVKELQDRIKTLDDFTSKRILATKALLAAQIAYDAAKEGGDQQAIDAARKRLVAVEAERNAVDSANAHEIQAQKKVAQAIEDRYERARQAFLQYQKASSRGEFSSKKDELRALQSIAAGLNGDALKEAQGQLRQIRGEILSEEVAALKDRVSKQKLSVEESKRILDGLLSHYEANADQRKKLEKEVADIAIAEAERASQVREQLLSEQSQLELEAKQRSGAQKDVTIENLEHRLELLKDQISLELEAKDTNDLGQAEAKLKAVGGVVRELKDEITARTENLKKLADEAAALDLIALKKQKAADIEANPQNADLIAANTEAKIRALKEETAEKKAELDRKNARELEALDKRRDDLLRKYDAEADKRSEKARDKAKKANQEINRELDEANTIRSKELGREIKELQKESSEGGADNTDKIKAKLQEQARLQLELAVSQIKAEAEKEKAAAQSAQARELIEGNAQAKIRAAYRDTAEEYKKAVDDQLAELKRLEDASKGDESQFKVGFRIDEFAEQLKKEQGTSRRRGKKTGSTSPLVVPGVDLSSLTAASVSSPRVATPVGVAASQAAVAARAALDLNVTFDEKGKPEAKVTSLDGRFSEVSRSARGMRGRLSYG